MDKIKKIICAIAFMQAGCATTSGIPLSEPKIGSTPGDELIHTISAGEVLYSKFHYVNTPSAIVNGKFDIGIIDSAIISSELALTQLKNTKAYCGEFNRYTPGNIIPWHGCFIDADSDGRFESLIYAGASTSINAKPKYITKINMSEGFNYEIIFQGRTEKTLKFKYREFSGSMARPAFSEDFEYLINNTGATTGSFKGLKIDVTSIEGNYINYRVIGDMK